jgi:hypothetical protein
LTAPPPLLHTPIIAIIFKAVIVLYILNTAVPLLLLLLLGSFTHVLVHEMGHSAPILLRTPATVTIYIGSFGDARRSFHLRTGRLTIVIKHNPFLWFKGMCKPHASFPLNLNMLYVATGPLGSLLLGIAAALLLLIPAIPGVVRGGLGFIVLFSILGLMGSTIPMGRQRYTRSGTPVYPDLILFLRLWRSKRLA